jgi:Trehalase
MSRHPKQTDPATWPYPLTEWKRPVHYKDRAAAEPLVTENTFIGRRPDRAFPKHLPESRAQLPKPHWPARPTVIDSYWRAWDLAFRNTRRAPLESGFITPFIDTAFNDCLFMWDSVFILMFARYGERAFPFQATLDNFYAKQHPNGFICREIRQWSGEDYFHATDPNATGPNLLPWSEWEYFQQFGDRERLAEVFPALLAFNRWFRRNRTWPDGSYWSTGWACGMDNQPRVSLGAHPKWDHGHMSWLDTTAQAVFTDRILLQMAAVLGREADVAAERAEIESLGAYINDKMWHEAQGFYVDRRRDGSLSDCKSIAGFWPLAAGIVPPDRRDKLIDHLSNPATFGRPHPVPSLSADNPAYRADTGEYWLGAVWPSTNYMVLRALTGNGADALAFELGLKHLDMVTRVFEETGTHWENYVPEAARPGTPAQGDFVGWGGVGPIAVLLEYVFGLRPDFARDVLVWDVRLTDAHGVDDYPYGRDTTLSLHAESRERAGDEPRVTVRSNRALRIELRWDGGSRVLDVVPA